MTTMNDDGVHQYTIWGNGQGRGDVQKSGREEVMGAGESGTEGLR